jgi:hypothetical protein
MKLRSRYSAQLAAAGSEGHAVPVQGHGANLAIVAPVAAARVLQLRGTWYRYEARGLAQLGTVALRHCNDT